MEQNKERNAPREVKVLGVESINFNDIGLAAMQVCKYDEYIKKAQATPSKGVLLRLEDKRAVHSAQSSITTRLKDLKLVGIVRTSVPTDPKFKNCLVVYKVRQRKYAPRSRKASPADGHTP